MTIIQANKFFYLRGGAERYMIELSAHLASRGNTVIPFAMQHPKNFPSPYAHYFPSYVETERVSFGPNALRTFGRMLYSREAKHKMADLVKDVQPDLAHVHNIYTQLSPSILTALSRGGVPTVMTVHDHHLISPQYNIWAEGCGPDLQHAGILRATASRFHKHSYAASFAQAFAFEFQRVTGVWRKNIKIFICPSVYMRRRLLADGIPAHQIRVVPYGIDPDRIQPRFDHDGYFLFVGRLSEEKGVELIIRLAEHLPDLPFKIAGTGPEETKLHRMAHRFSNLEFVGFQSGESLDRLYQGARAVLLPSRVQETFPLTILEAMAAGKPVIASHVGGVPEVVEDRVTGFLAAPNDIRAWIEAVMRLAYDEENRTRMGRAARLATETTFHVKHHWDKMEQVYREAKHL